MTEIAPILIGKGEKLQYLHPGYANRHGLITGATGTSTGMPASAAIDAASAATAISAFSKPGPSAATIASARSMYGKAINMSTARMITLSVRPPK